MVYVVIQMLVRVGIKSINIFVLPLQFYFGDRNYSKDRFLKEKAEEDDGCILKHFLQIKVLDKLWDKSILLFFNLANTRLAYLLLSG